MNWFQRHLNWSTFAVAAAFYLLVAGLALGSGPALAGIEDVAGLAVVVGGPVALIPVHFGAIGVLAWGTGGVWLAIAMGAYAWAKIAWMKGRSGAWVLAPLALPLGWVALMALRNHREGQ